MGKEKLSRDEQLILIDEAVGSRPEIVSARDLIAMGQRAKRAKVGLYRPIDFGKSGFDYRDVNYEGRN